MPYPEADRDEPRALAFEILLRVDTAGAYAGILLDHRERRLRDPRAAALLHRTVLEVLQRRAALDHALSAVADRAPAEMDPAVRTALRIGAHGLLCLDRVPDFAAVSTAVDLVKAGRSRRAAGFVNAVLRRVAARGAELLPPAPAEGDVPALALAASHPEWWTRRQVARLGWHEARRLLEADNAPPPVAIRARGGAGRAAELAERLASEGVGTEPGRYDPAALRIVRGVPGHSAALAAGLGWVQDEASQLVPQLLGARVGPRAADLCAAPGTKSLLLAERLVADGVLIAVDRHLGRLGRLVATARTLESRDVLALCADMTAPLPPFAQSFDHVLVDAPCSGTGTLRRHPEIRWRLTEDALEGFARRQARLLAVAAGLLREGGVLVYSVCSMEPEEGERVVDAFLAATPDFALEDPRPHLPAPAADLVREPGFLHTSPVRGGLDGFFAARIVRRGR